VCRFKCVNYILNPFKVRCRCRSKIEFAGEFMGHEEENNLRLEIQRLKEELNRYRQSGQLLSHIEKHAKIGWWEWNLSTNQMAWSDEVFHILGLDKQNCHPSLTAFEDVIHPEDLQYFKNELVTSVILNELNDVRLRLIRPGGEIAYAYLQGTYVSDSETEKLVGTIQDVSEKHGYDLKLQEKNEQLASLFSATSDSVFIFDFNGICCDYYPAFGGNNFLSREKAIGLKLSDLFDERKVKGALRTIRSVISNKTVFVTEFEIEWNNRKKLVEARIVPYTGHQALLLVKDITQRTEDEGIIIKLSQAVEQSPVSVVITDLEGTIVYVNPKFTAISGYPLHEAIGANPRILKSGTHPRAFYENMWSKLSQGEQWSGVLHNRKKNGQLYFESATISPIRNELGEITNYIGVKEDITERVNMEQALRDSESVFRTIFENAFDGILIVDPKTLSIYQLNQTLCNMLGYNAEESKHIRLEDIHLPPDMEKIREGISSQAYNEVVYNGTLQVVRKDKSQFAAEIHTSPIIILGKRFVLAIFRDITERLNAEKALKESEARWKFALEGSNDGVWDWNLLTNEVYFSKQWKNMLGYSEEDVENVLDSWSEKVHPDDMPQCMADVNKHLNGETEVYKNLHRLRCKDGTYKWILDRGKVTTFGNDGKPLRFVGTHTDMTERIQMEQELLKLNIDKDRFMSIIAHDLRSPFNGMLGFLDLIIENMDEYPPEKLRGYLVDMRKSSKLAYELLEDLLMWSKSHSGALTPQITTVAIMDACTEVVDMFSASLARKQIKIHSHVNRNLKISTDKSFLQTVLRNIVSNAIKFTNRDGEIALSASKNGESFLFCIRDNGVGMDAVTIEKLWKFTRPYTSKGTEKEKGTGFGLLLCKELVEKQGGRIWVESELGRGSIFYFTLPVEMNTTIHY
jgi:PAS domain S-box-containing protein